jgi:hypothetical protein
MVSALADIARLVPESGRGLYGSAGEPYRDAIFGRDSVEAGEHLVHLKPAIARGVILERGWRPSWYPQCRTAGS